MKKLWLPAVFLLAFSFLGFAHEFWLAPQRFFYRVRETAHIRFHVGEGFAGENWGGSRVKVQQLVHYKPSDEQTDIARLVSDNKGDSVDVPLQEPGTHMIIFNSTNSFIRLDATKFNEYLAEDGLAEAALYRKVHNEEQKDGREYFQRSVKTIIQVGDKVTDRCVQPTTLPLDIVPEINPYENPETLNRAGLQKVRFRLLFKGSPLANHTVKIFYRPPGKTVVQEELKTNRNGYITTARNPGRFMVSSVYMERNRADTSADWQSYWSSCTFEYTQIFPERSTGMSSHP